MIRAPYVPQPGTIPFRVIQHLKTLRDGAEVSTPELCEALDLELTGPFRAYMEGALRNGAVKSTIRPRGSRNVAHWSLGDGVPLPAPQRDTDEDELQPDPPPVPGSGWPIPTRSVFELASASSGEEKPEADAPPCPTPTQAPTPTNVLGWTPAPPAPQLVDTVGPEEMADAVAASAISPHEEADEPFVCALWSDGRLQLQRGDTELALLSVDETRALLRYLDRVCAAEDRD